MFRKSVIATIPGTTKASEVVVIGAHLDSTSSGATAPHRSRRRRLRHRRRVTGVLRALLASKDFRPGAPGKEHRVRHQEEVGLRGSNDIVAECQDKGTNVVGVPNLGMTNFKGSPLDIYLIRDYTNAAQNAFVGT